MRRLRPCDGYDRTFVATAGRLRPYGCYDRTVMAVQGVLAENRQRG
ncbi:hypothetical protein ACFXAZ_13550 [Streptomyces sp. NPDC059477]